MRLGFYADEYARLRELYLAAVALSAVDISQPNSFNDLYNVYNDKLCEFIAVVLANRGKTTCDVKEPT